MDNSKFFIWINRINSIAILLLLLCGLGFSVIAILDGLFAHEKKQTLSFDNQQDSSHQEPALDLRLGQSYDVCGTDISYIELQTQPRSAGFSSGYHSDTKNILFSQLTTMENWWLFGANQQTIERITQLSASLGASSICDSGDTIAIMYEITAPDSDQRTLALSSPDGRHYQVISKDIDQLIESKVSRDGKFLIMIEQVGDSAFFRKYAISQQEKITETVISHP